MPPNINPVEFGEVKAQGEASRDRLDKIDSRFDKVESTQSKHSVGIILACLSPFFAGVAFKPEAAAALVSYILHLFA